MSCVEKRHMSHRMGSMLHHRFPNGFTDLFMDETDREVSTLTDRAFRSLCVGDDAVYNDEFLCGYSPLSCHKPLAEEPLKKTHHKESKKQGHHHRQSGKNDVQSWKQQQNMSHVSSFLKALSATEESCEGMLIKNGGMNDTNGESWDKSALRSIQRELSEFSSDYHANLTDGHYKNHHRHPSGDKPPKKTGKDAALPSGKSSKNKAGKAAVKLKKLNIKNFFLHSEFSPFQTWRDFNRFPFSQEDPVTSIVPTDNIPKWYESPFYKELTEAHRKETEHEEAQPCQKPEVEPPPPTAPKLSPPPSPPKVLPKPPATPADKRCLSEGGDGTAAPWRRNRSRAKSAIPVNQPGILSPPQDNCSKTADESVLLVKKEIRSVEIKAVEDVSSLASTPFSICQLMTPVIPSRQPTETSEILQALLSPSALDLPLRPDSEAKLTPEPPVKRDSYKSLASSILFNLKDNRKRVKSRYSPPKFKTSELPDRSTQSPQPDQQKRPQAGSDGNVSGLSTPAILKDGQTICSPVLEAASIPNVGDQKDDADRPLSDDYLLSNLLQTKREAAGSRTVEEENQVPPFVQSRKNKSPVANKKSYPSLNLYKKASPIDHEMKHLQVGQSVEKQGGLSPITQKELSTPNTGPSPNANANKELSSNTTPNTKVISPYGLEKEGLPPDLPVGKKPPNVPENAKQLVKDATENDSGVQSVSSKEEDIISQPLSTMDVIRAAREAITAAKNKVLSAAQSESNNKLISDITEQREKDDDEQVANSKKFSSKAENSVTERNILSESKNEVTTATVNAKKEPPPVPKRNFAKSDIQHALDKQQTVNADRVINGDLGDAKGDSPPKDNDSVQILGKLKHVFSARQNNFIKYQRYAMTEDEQTGENEEVDLKLSPRMEKNEEAKSHVREISDSEHLINDLHALKELERAKLGDRVLENARNKLGLMKIEEETKAKNDLISRELRNIKKGMMSMRGNTLAKKEYFAKKEKEQIKQEVFTKIDSNVIVNKALINDNYDKAKMALEEIISEREKRKNTQDANPKSQHTYEENYITKVQQHKNTEAQDIQNGSISTLKEKEVKERLGDLRDHSHMKQILSQTEPRPGGKLVPPVMDKVYSELNKLLKNKSKHREEGQDKLNDNSPFSNNSEDLNLKTGIARQVSEESSESQPNEYEGRNKKRDAPPVPPRSKRVGVKRDESDTKETDSLKDATEDDVSNTNGKYENVERQLIEEMRSTSSGAQQVDRDLSSKETVLKKNELSPNKEMLDVLNNAKLKLFTETDVSEPVLTPKYPQLENEFLNLSPGDNRVGKNTENNLAGFSPSSAKAVNHVDTQEGCKVKRKAPLKPDDLNPSDVNATQNQVAEEPDKINKASEDVSINEDVLGEIPKKIISPILLVNGININQSPPDQASSSSKSSYFSVESALHRNTESESNIYHSIENLIDELEEVEVTGNDLGNQRQDSERTEVEYYSVSDHESEPDVVKQLIKCPQKEEAPCKEDKEPGKDKTGHSLPQDVNDQTPMSPSSIVSPNLGIPALFKVKDNTIMNKTTKSIQPWSPRESLSGSERGEDELHQIKETPELPQTTETAPNISVPTEISKPKEILSNPLPPLLLSPLHLQSENSRKPQAGSFLTVPQEEDRNSGLSPSSEGVESLTNSTTDTADEMGLKTGVLQECEVSKLPSERSGSTCSGNDSQTGMSKPPAILPKSEKAVLKAMKLTNRRMKKEEAQNKPPQKPSQSSSKPKTKNDKSEHEEHKSSSNSRNGEKHGKTGEKKPREKLEHSHRHSRSHPDKDSNDRSVQRRVHSSENHRQRTDYISQKPGRQSRDQTESNNQNSEILSGVATERQGRSTDRRVRDQPEQRDYSSDRVISNVPVYKAHVAEGPASDRPYYRSLSTDRYLGNTKQRRLSTDTSISEKLEPRSQRIEKSIMDELQQRGRAREKPNRENPLRRSHSIDAYSVEVPHPPGLSRQSSHTSQISRQSSIEHAIVAQSFPITQRKILQDPDSGQYFVVDMPIQVKTKTFFDPSTGNYVQLPVQPPEGAVPQASPMEVLNPPLVVYHGFVPVPLSPMTRNSTIQTSHVEPEEFEQRHLERSRQMFCQEGRPYLEPVYGQHDHMLGEFLGTEELDCVS